MGRQFYIGDQYSAKELKLDRALKVLMVTRDESGSSNIPNHIGCVVIQYGQVEASKPLFFDRTRNAEYFELKNSAHVHQVFAKNLPIEEDLQARVDAATTSYTKVDNLFAHLLPALQEHIGNLEELKGPALNRYMAEPSKHRIEKSYEQATRARMVLDMVKLAYGSFR